MKIAIVTLLLVAAFFFWPHASEREPAAARRLPPPSRWTLVGVFPLAGQTGHPQGLNVARDLISLSTMGDSTAALLRYRAIRDAQGVLKGVTPAGRIDFNYPGLLHAGGLGRSRDRSIVYVPVAAPRIGDTQVVAVDSAGHIREITRYPFHIGAVIFDPWTGIMRFMGRDVGARFELFGNTIYSYDLATNTRVGSPFKPNGTYAFQDCKPISQGEFLCSDKQGFNVWTLYGTLDLVRFNADGSYEVREQMHVPHVNLDGSFAGATGTYVPRYYGTPPLTYNAFDFEIADDQKSVVFYFVPNDQPDTRIYAYRLQFQ